MKDLNSLIGKPIDLMFEVIAYHDDRHAFEVRAWSNAFKEPASAYPTRLFSVLNINPEENLHYQIARFCLAEVNLTILRESGHLNTVKNNLTDLIGQTITFPVSSFFQPKITDVKINNKKSTIDFLV